MRNKCFVYYFIFFELMVNIIIVIFIIWKYYEVCILFFYWDSCFFNIVVLKEWVVFYLKCDEVIVIYCVYERVNIVDWFGRFFMVVLVVDVICVDKLIEKFGR